jgi:hypothetical protein
MAKRLIVQVSEDAARNLASLQRSSDLDRDAAMSWILLETSVPSIPKRGKTTRGETVYFSLSDAAIRVLDYVCVSNGSNEGIVIEAYLSRKY